MYWQGVLSVASMVRQESSVHDRPLCLRRGPPNGDGEDSFRLVDPSPLKASAGTRLWYRAMDAVLTSPLPGNGAAADDGRRRLSTGSSNYERLRAAVRLARSLLPRVVGELSDRLCRPDRLPLRGARVSLLAYGSAATVFRIQAGPRDLVLKIYRDTLGLTEAQLRTIAATFRDTYEFMCSCFDGLVPHSTYVVLHGPLLGKPAVAELQDHVAGEKRDLLDDFTDAELRDLLRRDPDLRERFARFVDRLAQLDETYGLTIDLLGRKNVVLARDGDGDGRWRLHVIDYALFDLRGAPRGPTSTQSRRRERLDRLLGLLTGPAPRC